MIRQTQHPKGSQMTDHLEWLESQARLARQQIEQQSEIFRLIYEADLRVAMSGRDGDIMESPPVSQQISAGTI